METKIKSYGDEVTGFYYKEIPKVDFNNTCAAVSAWILLSGKMKNVMINTYGGCFLVYLILTNKCVNKVRLVMRMYGLVVKTSI